MCEVFMYTAAVRDRKSLSMVFGQCQDPVGEQKQKWSNFLKSNNKSPTKTSNGPKTKRWPNYSSQWSHMLLPAITSHT